MIDFKVIQENVTGQIVEKKSKFIANIFYVETKEEAEEILKKIKKKYYDARHNCYAYRITEGETIVERSSDDGEPSGTAGPPILDILTKQNLANVLVIVTRYFGGILLGTGGLVRAYAEATKKALSNTQFIDKTIGYKIKVEVKYTNLEQLKYTLTKENVKITDICYKENVELILEISKEKWEIIKHRVEELKCKTTKEENATKKYVEI